MIYYVSDTTFTLRITDVERVMTKMNKSSIHTHERMKIKKTVYYTGKGKGRKGIHRLIYFVAASHYLIKWCVVRTKDADVQQRAESDTPEVLKRGCELPLVNMCKLHSRSGTCVIALHHGGNCGVHV